MDKKLLNSTVIKKDLKAYLIAFVKWVSLSSFSIFAVFWVYCLVVFLLIRFTSLTAWGLDLVRDMIGTKWVFNAYQLIFAKPLGMVMPLNIKEILKVPYPRDVYLIREKNSDGGYRYGSYGLIEDITLMQPFDFFNPSCIVGIRSDSGVVRSYQLYYPGSRVFISDGSVDSGGYIHTYELDKENYCDLQVGERVAIIFYSLKDYGEYMKGDRAIGSEDAILVLTVLSK